ncbi:MAG: hypothetical protein ABSA09_11125 [Desulfobaccales bacterium]|jgi:hypothetical protein
MKMRLTSVLVLAFALAVCAPASASIIYSNGLINGTEGRSISGISGWEVADSFVSAGSATVTGFDAGIWVSAGDTPTTVTWTILTGGPSWNGGTTVASGNATWSNILWGQYPTIYIYSSTVSGLDVAIGAGTYWLELSKGSSVEEKNVSWDENDGPSTAYQYTGTSTQIGSEAFTVYGTPVPVPPSALLLGSGLLGLAGWRRLRKS